MEHLYAVIIAGGAGTRFWPASRHLTPKQLLPLGSSATELLLTATVRRLEPICPMENIFLATGQHLVEATRSALPALPEENVLPEPLPRNTAPCIGWAAHVIARKDPDAVIMVFPADHAVSDEEAFRGAIVEAAGVAATGRITTIGLEPTRAETGFGYIEVGAEIGGRAFEVARFVEKPNAAVAEQFLAGKKHVWNGGMFFFRAKDLIAEIREHLPELHAGLEALDRAHAEGREAEELARIFPTLPSISIDHGVMEKARKMAVVRASFGWSDVGSWESAWELAAKDEAGNAAPDSTVLVDARDNLVRDQRTDGRKRVVALLGVSDLVVVETDDALLVMPRARAQDVRAIVDELKKRGGTSV